MRRDERAADHFPPVTQGEVVGFSNHGSKRTSGTVTRLGPVRRAAAARFGVDRLSLSFPVARMDDSPEAWPVESVRMRGTAGESWTRGRTFTDADHATGEAGKVTVFVGVTEVQGQLWGKVEANPSRFQDPSGCSLLDLADLQPAVNALAATAQLLMEPAEPVRHWRVKRIDLARDFRGIGEPSFYVRGLLNVHRPYARRTYIYADPSKNQAQTLWAGGKTGGARLYDQHEAYAEKGAPQGSLRWEVEARGGKDSWLDRAGVVTVQDMVTDTAPLWRLAENRWEWSGMGRELASASTLVEQVRALGLSSAKRQRLLGALLEEACGTRQQQSKETEAEYRRLKAELGCVMVPALDLIVGKGPKRGRLDWSTGTELVAA